jgi:hypothetical protein
LVGGRLCLLNNHRFLRCVLGRGRLCFNLGAWLWAQPRFWLRSGFWFWNRVRFWDGVWDRFRIRNGFWLRNGLWFRFWFFDDDGCRINAKRTGGAQRL